MSEDRIKSLKALLFRLENLLDLGNWEYVRVYGTDEIEGMLREVTFEVISSPLYTIEPKTLNKIRKVLKQDTKDAAILAANMVNKLNLEEQKLS